MHTHFKPLERTTEFMLPRPELLLSIIYFITKLQIPINLLHFH